MKPVQTIGLMLLALAAAHAWQAMAENTVVESTAVEGSASEERPLPFLGGYLKETRVIYPLRLGDWNAMDEHRYDQVELGVSVRYQQGERKDRWMDVYFYPAGVLLPSQLDQHVASTLEGIRTHAATPGGYKHLSIDPVQPFAFQWGPREQRRRVEGRSVSLRYEAEGRTYHSAMVLLVKDLYYIKGRLSVQADAVSQDKVRSQLQRMIENLIFESRIVSTGECWSPQPIATPPPPPRSNTKRAQAGVKKHDPPAVKAHADRVGAPVAQLPAKSMAGWRPEGCVPPEDLNPEVPADHREIRIEYHAPSEQGDGTTPRLRSLGYGVT